MFVGETMNRYITRCSSLVSQAHLAHQLVWHHLALDSGTPLQGCFNVLLVPQPGWCQSTSDLWDFMGYRYGCSSPPQKKGKKGTYNNFNHNIHQLQGGGVVLC